MSTPATDQAFEKLLEQHRALKELLGRIGTMLHERTASIEQGGDLLGQLGDQLVKHFAFEEAGGYFDEALLQAPRLVGRANDLVAQHPKMTARAQELLQAGPQRAADWWDQTTARVDAFVKELLQHEQSENRLLQEAYSRDVAAGD